MERTEQLNCVLKQRIPIPAKELPVAVRAIDGHGAERSSQLDDSLHVYQGLLGLEASVLLRVDTPPYLASTRPA